ncbi:MAG TPA: isocitrate lyase/PEP mutase family protein [Acetobacteraceae bacterium]|nr:isocitrate lyase/PEP mutase family protein [Acetobacteraceae bacterium]
MSASHAARLRSLLREQPMLTAPGAYDAITARLVVQAGFPVVYMTGAGTAATLGFPDYGLITATEMVDNAARLVRAADAPVISDGDTGYGNELNVVRLVQDHARAGTAGIHIEDQVHPKKCGHLDDKQIVPREEWLAKIRAAVAARPDPDFVVIARTDSRAVAGFEEAVARCNAALAAGADIAFLEAPQTMEEVASVPKRVNGPCLYNLVKAGKSPDVGLDDAQALGYRLVIVPGLLFKTVMKAGDAALATLKQTRRHPEVGGLTVRDAFARVGAAEWDRYRTMFRADAPREAAE